MDIYTTPVHGMRRKKPESKTLDPPQRSPLFDNAQYMCGVTIDCFLELGGSCWATPGQERNASDSFLLWERRAGGVEGRGERGVTNNFCFN